jgi:hypothetical protein
MRNFTVQTGGFTNAGNFTAYSALGERVFIHKRVMQSQKWAKDSDVTFPFYAIIDTKEIGQLDDAGKPKMNDNGTVLLVERLQALSIFASEESLTNAQVDNVTLDIRVKSAIKSSASSAGLTESAIESLLAVAF